jgi:hypothetical protein
MGRRLSIPLATDAPSPRLDAVRTRLGGRATSDAGVGALVEIRRGALLVAAGVVLFVSGDELHVMTDDTLVRRTSRAATRPLTPFDPSFERLAPLAADARVFAHLREGERIRYVENEGSLREGTLLEKCRYGAIVLVDDRKLMGVGFRKVWPLGSAATS